MFLCLTTGVDPPLSLFQKSEVLIRLLVPAVYYNFCTDAAMLLLLLLLFSTLEGYWPRDKKKKSRLSPYPVKRTIGEIETDGGGPF